MLTGTCLVQSFFKLEVRRFTGSVDKIAAPKIKKDAYHAPFAGSLSSVEPIYQIWSLYLHLLYPVYTIQPAVNPIVKPVVQPVWQQVV